MFFGSLEAISGGIAGSLFSAVCATPGDSFDSSSMKWAALLGFIPGSFVGAALGALVESITSGSMGLIFGIVRLRYVKIK